MIGSPGNVRFATAPPAPAVPEVLVPGAILGFCLKSASLEATGVSPKATAARVFVTILVGTGPGSTY
jgi:hypothetical protein